MCGKSVATSAARWFFFDARPNALFVCGSVADQPLFFIFQDLQTWAYGAYTPTLDGLNDGMNDTGVCLTQPGEPPAAMKVMAIVTLGSGRLVELYGPPSSVVWLPQGRELPPVIGNEELTEVLGLTERV